jgi:hypothetical protein
MIPKALNQQLPTSAWARLPAPQTRRFVSHEVLRLIRRTDLGEASLKAFRFQAPSDCVNNSRAMREALVNSLMEKGLLTGPTPNEEKWNQTLCRWLGLARPTVERTLPSAEQLMRLTASTTHHTRWRDQARPARHLELHTRCAGWWLGRLCVVLLRCQGIDDGVRSCR